MNAASPAKRAPIIIFLVVLFALGLALTPHYPESWDEASKRAYADYAIHAYQYFFHPNDLPLHGNELNYYGPAYFMLAAFCSRMILALAPSWTIVNAWHFVYFVTFLAGAYILYLLSRRFVDEWAAFGAAVLYCAQPLVWGHAFINPKDTPFTTFFMASLYLGLKMADEEKKRYLWAILAGIVLGFSTSLRILAPYAAVMVILYAIYNNFSAQKPTPSGKNLFIAFGIYAIVAIAATYLLWPYLWADPVGRFLESLRVMSAFPFDQTVLFKGELYPASDLPLSYVPTLLRIQLTEPLLILSVFGCIVSLNHFVNKRRETLGLFVLWFLLPVSAIVLSGNTLYDNFRQLFFLLPPIFILAGLALDYVFRKFKTSQARLFILALLVAPGVYAAIQLHPYEYVYYNASIGGTQGAFRDFEMDYWDTSFPEAARYLNGVAPQNAKVIVIGSVDLFRAYAPPDLQIVNIDIVKEQGGVYDYVVIHSRRNLDERRCKDASVIYTVEREDAVFVVIKKLTKEGQCP